MTLQQLPNSILVRINLLLLSLISFLEFGISSSTDRKHSLAMEGCSLHSPTVTTLPSSIPRTGFTEKPFVHGQILKFPNAKKYPHARKLNFLNVRAQASGIIYINHAPGPHLINLLMLNMGMVRFLCWMFWETEEDFFLSLSVVVVV